MPQLPRTASTSRLRFVALHRWLVDGVVTRRHPTGQAVCGDSVDSCGVETADARVAHERRQLVGRDMERARRGVPRAPGTRRRAHLFDRRRGQEGRRAGP